MGHDSSRQRSPTDTRWAARPWAENAPQSSRLGTEAIHPPVSGSHRPRPQGLVTWAPANDRASDVSPATSVPGGAVNVHPMPEPDGHSPDAGKITALMPVSNGPDLAGTPNVAGHASGRRRSGATVVECPRSAPGGQQTANLVARASPLPEDRRASSASSQREAPATDVSGHRHVEPLTKILSTQRLAVLLVSCAAADSPPGASPTGATGPHVAPTALERHRPARGSAGHDHPAP